MGAELSNYTPAFMQWKGTQPAQSQHINNSAQREEQDDYQCQKMFINQQLFKVQTKDLNKLLHRSIGAIKFLDKNRKPHVGSGLLISRNLVLTSAHNVYDRKKNFVNDKDMYFCLEKNGTGEIYCKIEGVKYLRQYEICKSQEAIKFDFALLKLSKDVQFDKFPMFRLPCQTCLLTKNSQIYLSIFGYPFYKDNHKDKDSKGVTFYLSQYGLERQSRITSIDLLNNKICYTISTMPGQSGSPISIEQQYIIAIHNQGKDNNQEKYNIGTLVNINMLDKLEEWRHQLKGDPFEINAEKVCQHLQSRYKQYFLKNRKNEKRLTMQGKQLKEINLRDKNCTHLDLSYNQLSSIDVTKNIELVELDVRFNQLSTIDLSKNISLIQLDLWKNQIYKIDVSNNINLIHLDLSSNQLSAIDVSKNINLTQLNLSYNKISTIDVSKNINLTDLRLSQNILQSISVSFSSKLQYYQMPHQRSSVCKIQIFFYNSNDSQVGTLLKEKLAQKYQKGNAQQNKYKCNYIVTTVKIG